MSVLHAIILGIVEGITEFLPISSTGHMTLVSALLGLTETPFLKDFQVIIQLGAILAVVVMYFKKFFDLELIKKLIIAFLPTAVIGLVLYHAVKTYLLGNVAVVTAALFLGGVFLIWFESRHKPEEELSHTISYRQAFSIGLAQAVSIIPGVSRSAATIIGGRALGVSRTAIVEFSFLLAVPTMLAATGLDLVKSNFAFTPHEWTLLAVGLVVSFVVALASIRWFLAYIRTHSFTGFGWYRIIIAVLFIAFFFA